MKYLQSSHKKVFLFTTIAICVYSVFILLSYTFNWTWTGFPEKTIWDWTVLLILPIALSFSAILLNRADQKREQETVAKKEQIEREISLDNQRETILQNYLDRMSDLMLDKDLKLADKGSEARTIARSCTLTALPLLDKKRKSSLLRFLYESGLIIGDESSTIVNLRNADFYEIDMQGEHLVGINLSGAKLVNTNLAGANLENACLCGADLEGANLKGAYLKSANLGTLTITTTSIDKVPVRHVKYTNLTKANLRSADLTNANFRSSMLKDADIIGASIYEACFVNSCIDGISAYSKDLGEIMNNMEDIWA